MDKPIIRIEPINTSVVFIWKWITFPAQTISERQVTVNLPVVSSVDRIGKHPQRVWIPKLRNFAGTRTSGRQSEKERCPTIEPVCSRRRTGETQTFTLRLCCARRATLERRRVAIEYECTARRLKGSTLWLEVINLLVLIVDSKAVVVRPFQPGYISRNQILVITKQERTARVGVTQIRPIAVKLKRRNSALKHIWSVGSGNFQNIQAKVGAEVVVLSSESLARVPNIRVENDIRIEGVGTTHADNLNSRRSRALLATIESITTGLSKD